MTHRNETYDFVNGAVLLLDKPFGWTSFDLVGKVRNLVTRKLGLKKLKVGHAGTLDPLASGLMIICTGKFTKRIQEFQGMDKSYRAVIELGKTTPSFDLETGFDAAFEYRHIDKIQVEQALEKFTGEQDQVPPVYSAKFINGDRAYEYARKGETPDMKASRIIIHQLKLVSYTPPVLTLDVLCSKGTYIRALARDIGRELGTGAYLKSLVRTSIGPYTLEQSKTIEHFEKMLQNI